MKPIEQKNRKRQKNQQKLMKQTKELKPIEKNLNPNRNKLNNM